MSTVAIIGAGPSGLASAKEALANGLTPTVFEKDKTIGGLWKPETGSTWEGMQTNISHYTNMFSDFPWKEGSQDFPTQEEVYHYLVDYADHFKINPHLALSTEVKKVQQKEKWTIEYVQDGISQSQEFDYVIVCSGIFSKAFIPEIPGIEKFKGEVIHSKDYKKPDAFEGRQVVVIGNAFSGCEIAASLAQKTDRIVHVQRRPMWIIPRYLEETIPCDLRFYSRLMCQANPTVTEQLMNKGKNHWMQRLCARQEKIPALQVKTPFENPPFALISDHYLDAVETGKIRIQTGSIHHVEANTIHFQDQTTIAADALLFCTGYRTSIPFLDQTTQKKMGFAPDDPLQPLLLHQCVFPQDVPNLACVGLYRGPFFGVMELQARLATMSFAGKIPLPTAAEIEKGIQEEQIIRDQLPRKQFPHGNYVQLCEEYAKRIGALPSLDKIKTQDPAFYQQLWSGPFSVASYRLEGPHSNPEQARKIIMETNKRIRDC